jgi:hypothetical protein
MAASLKVSTVAAPAADNALAASLHRWQQRVPEARRLTWCLRAPRGTDAALVRRALLDGLSCLPDPLGWDAGDVGFDVAATGSAGLFGEALAGAARQAHHPLVLRLPEHRLASPAQDLQAPDAVTRLAEALAGRCAVTVSLAARLQRSRDDAQRAAEQGWSVRLVPGAVADPQQPQLAAAAGLMSMLRQLAGRVPHVTLAWPDASAALEAVRVLQRAGTPCDIELVHGQAIGPLRQMARRLGVPLRFVCDWPWPEPGVSAPR